MINWTKIEAYTGSKSFAWEAVRHRLKFGPMTYSATVEDMMRSALPPHLVIDPKHGIQFGFGGRRSGKTERLRSMENGPIWIAWDPGREMK